MPFHSLQHIAVALERPRLHRRFNKDTQKHGTFHLTDSGLQGMLEVPTHEVTSLRGYRNVITSQDILFASGSQIGYAECEADTVCGLKDLAAVVWANPARGLSTTRCPTVPILCASRCCIYSREAGVAAGWVKMLFC